MHQKISIRSGRDLLFIETNHIILIKAENIYSTVYLETGRQLLALHTLKEMSEKLQQSNFFKPHRSYIINTHFIERYVKTDLFIYLKTISNPIPLSRNRKTEFEKLISQD